ncbi:hypothetical protein [Georgenia sp. SYP-B2076]|uniref:hypothetical protein n=1 Tax=Georgenia sp. SYP-B2076 TaxID=2495881 RepID=UPI000F8F3654|nr:hypothetical protein [Georgenia sp. SYP-B2076]
MGGTGSLLRLYLRLDRMRAVVWALAICVVVAGSVASRPRGPPAPDGSGATLVGVGLVAYRRRDVVPG